MGGAPSFNPFSFTFFPIVVVTVTTTLILIASADQDHDSKENGGIPDLEDDNGAATSSPSPVSSTSSSGHQRRKSVASKPSTAVIIGILTTIVSITLLVLLYIKHCYKGNMLNNNATNANANVETRLQDRNNSGIERTVVESLPAFKFGSLRGQKNGLECAVCLNGFEDPEVLRLLPKCKHAFHIECVDMWLGEHSTCPLCRYKVDPNDIIIPPRKITEEEPSSSNVESGRIIDNKNVLENSETSSSRKLSLNSNSININLRDVRSDGAIGEHKLEHRIIVSPTCSYTSCSGVHQRGSSFEKCHMLYLTSDGIISDNLSSPMNNTHRGRRTMVEHNRDVIDDEMENGLGGGKRYLRSVSEMTGIRRFMSSDRERRGGREGQENQREGAVLRWLNWISKSKSQRV